MPVSKKPTRRRTPIGLRRMPRYLTGAEMDLIFYPALRLTREILTDSVSVNEKNYPIMFMHDGAEVDAAMFLDSFCDFYQSIATRHQLPYDLTPLRRLGPRLNNGVPISEDEARAADSQLRRAYNALLRVERTHMRSHSLTEQIRIELDVLLAA